MEPIAENTTVVTKALFYEAMSAIDNYRAAAWKGMGVMAAAWLILAAFTVLNGYPFGMALMEMVILGAVGVWLMVLLPRSRYRRSFRAMEQRFNGNLTREIRFYRDCLEIETCMNTAEFAYCDIRAVRRTKNMLVIRMQDKTGFFAELSGFSKGNADTVERLMKNEGETCH